MSFEHLKGFFNKMFHVWDGNHLGEVTIGILETTWDKKIREI